MRIPDYNELKLKNSPKYRYIPSDFDEIAKKIKATRDRTFKITSKSKVKEKQTDGTEKEVEKDFVVNRTDGIAHVGSAALDNEECYMLQKLLRSWGLVYIEHQARI